MFQCIQHFFFCCFSEFRCFSVASKYFGVFWLFECLSLFSCCFNVFQYFSIISVYVMNGGIHARVIRPNIPTVNGVIHVIDNLLRYVYQNALESIGVMRDTRYVLCEAKCYIRYNITDVDIGMGTANSPRHDRHTAGTL